MSNITHIMPVLVLLSVVTVRSTPVHVKYYSHRASTGVIVSGEGRNATSPPENCDLVTRNLGLVNAVRNFAIQHNFCSSFAQLRFGHKRSTSNGQCDNVILMEKGVDAIHSPHASLWTRSVSRSIMQKDTVQYCLYLYLFFTCYRSFLHPRAAPVSPVSRYGNDSQQRGIGFVLTNCKM